MKALVVHHPYAEAIANGHKTLEVRTWKTSHRGRLAIVQSRKQKRHPYAGCVRAIVDLEDVVLYTGKGQQLQDSYGVPHEPWQFAWVLGNSRFCGPQPVPVKGQQGLYELPWNEDQLMAAARGPMFQLYTRHSRLPGMPRVADLALMQPGILEWGSGTYESIDLGLLLSTTAIVWAAVIDRQQKTWSLYMAPYPLDNTPEYEVAQRAAVSGVKATPNRAQAITGYGAAFMARYRA